MTREVTFKPFSLMSLPAIKIHHSPERSFLQIRLSESGKAPPLPPFSWWQCLLNFALWCAAAGCGASFEDHLQADKHPLLASLYRFHYTTRRLGINRILGMRTDITQGPTSGFALSLEYLQIRTGGKSWTMGIKALGLGVPS